MHADIAQRQRRLWMINAKGMVQLGAATYRIGEVSPGRYEAIRILDDVRMGTFETLPVLSVEAEGTGEVTLRAIARAALIQGKTSRSMVITVAKGVDKLPALAVLRRPITSSGFAPPA
jgi:hypothetical protein